MKTVYDNIGILSGCILLAFNFNTATAQFPQLSIQTGHKNAVTGLTFSPDLNYLLSSGEDQAVVTWDLKTGKQLSKNHLRGTFIVSTAISPDSKYVAIINNSGDLQRIDNESGEIISDTGGYRALYFSKNGCVLVAKDSELIALEYPTQKIEDVKPVMKYPGAVEQACFSDDGSYLTLYRKAKNEIEIISTGKTDRIVKKILKLRRKDNVYAFQYYPRFNYLVVHKRFKKGGETISILDVNRSNTEIFMRSSDHVNTTLLSFDLSPDGHYLALGQSDFTTYIWDIRSSKVTRLSDHSGEVSAIKFSAEGNLLATGSFDRSICLYQQEGNHFKFIRRLAGFVPRQECLVLTPDHRYIFGDENGKMYIQNTLSPFEFNSHELHRDKINRLSLFGQQRLTGVGDDDALSFFDLKTDSLQLIKDIYKRELLEHRAFQSFCTYNPLMLIYVGGMVSLFRYRTARVSALACSGSYCVCGGQVGLSKRRVGLKFYQMQDDDKIKLIRTVRVNKEKINGICFYPDGENVLSWGGKFINRAFRLPGKGSDNSSKIFITPVKKGRPKVYRKTPLAKINDVAVSDSTLAVSGISKKDYNFDHPKWGNNIFLFLEKYRQEDFPSDTVLIYTGKTNDKNSLPDISLAGSGPLLMLQDTLFYIQNNEIVKYDIANKQETGRYKGHTDVISDIKIDKTLNRLVSTSWDGTIKVWSLDGNNLIYTTIPTYDNGFVVFDTHNYYLGSKSIYDVVGFNYKGRYCSFDNFDLLRNRPEVVLQNIGSIDTTLISIYKSAYLERLKRMNLINQDFNKDFKLPNVVIKSRVPLSTDQQKITLAIEASDDVDILDRLIVKVNDILIFGRSGISIRDSSAKKVNLSVDILLCNGSNKIQISVLTVKNIESIRETVEVLCNPVSTPNPNLYLVNLAATKYRDTSKNLKYPVSDAQRWSDAFVENQQDHYGQIFIKSYTDENLTRKCIAEIRQWLQQTKPEDKVLILVSCHGLPTSDGNFYIATYDIDFKHPRLSGISFSDLDGLLESIIARQKVLIMDACYSDEDITDQGTADPRDTIFGGPGFKNDTIIKPSQIGKANYFALMRDIFVDLRQGSGATIISASRGSEPARESPDWHGGALMKALLDGLLKNAANQDGDKSITVSELHRYVTESVAKLTNGAQRPVARVENLSNDFPVWYCDGYKMPSLFLGR